MAVVRQEAVGELWPVQCFLEAFYIAMHLCA